MGERVRVLVVAPGRPVAELGEAATRTLARLLLRALLEGRRAGVDPPADLSAMAAALSAYVADVREDVRERDAVAVPADDVVVTMSVSYAEAAAMLGCCTATLGRWRRAGRIRGAGRRLVAADVRREADRRGR